MFSALSANETNASAFVSLYANAIVQNSTPDVAPAHPNLLAQCCWTYAVSLISSENP